MNVLTVHLTTLIITAVVILYSDHQGLQYFRGKKATLSKTFVTWSHRLVWVGLITMIMSGISLVLPTWEYRLQEPAFYIKMGFVLVLIVNSYAIGKLRYVAIDRRFDELSVDVQKTLMFSGALSAVGWVGAAIIGFFFL